MLLWVLLILAPLPLIIFTLNPGLFRVLDTQQDELMSRETTPAHPIHNNNQQPHSRSSQGRSNFAKLRHFLFKTRNSVLQVILATIVYGGFGVFLIQGYQHLAETSILRPLSIFTVAICMILFAIASFSTPHALYSPIHRDHQPPELQRIKLPPKAPQSCSTSPVRSTCSTTTSDALPSSLNTISREIDAAVKDRFDEFWYQHVGRYPYDNTIFFQNTWCKECNQPRPARSQHCSLCGHCVPRSDHHCWWLNTHVGAGNYKLFFIFLLAHSWLVTYGSFVMWTVMNNISQSLNLDEILYTYLITNGYDQWYHFPQVLRFFYKQQFLCMNHALLWFVTALITFLSLPVVLFTAYHIRLVLFNITTNEDTKRNYLKRWIQQTQLLDHTIEDSYNSIDEKLLKLGSFLDRQTFLKNIQEKSTPSDSNSSSTTATSVTTGVTNDGLDIVGCIGAPAVTPTANSQIVFPNGLPPASSHLNSQSCPSKHCQPCQHLDVTRLPFPTVVFPHLHPEYELSADEKVIAEVIELQQRPIGYQGWFEPPTSPFPTTSTPTISKNDQLNALPAPSLWTREYYTFAVNQNIYNRGILNNILDAFDLYNPTPYTYTTTDVSNSDNHINLNNLPFVEYDLETLLYLRDAAAEQFPSMTTDVDDVVDDTKDNDEPVEIPIDKLKVD